MQKKRADLLCQPLLLTRSALANNYYPSYVISLFLGEIPVSAHTLEEEEGIKVFLAMKGNLKGGFARIL
jgi:hypothetical protein